jgi:hypothetical protein
MRFLGFSNHEKGAPRQEISKWSTIWSQFSRSGWNVVRSASLAKGGTSKKRPSPHLHKVPARSNKVSPRTFQTALVHTTLPPLQAYAFMAGCFDTGKSSPIECTAPPLLSLHRICCKLDLRLRSNDVIGALEFGVRIQDANYKQHKGWMMRSDSHLTAQTNNLSFKTNSDPFKSSSPVPIHHTSTLHIKTK